MEQRLKLIKKFKKREIKNDFDSKYDLIKEMAKDRWNYNGEIKIIDDKKYISFYIIEEYDR